MISISRYRPDVEGECRQNAIWRHGQYEAYFPRYNAYIIRLNCLVWMHEAEESSSIIAVVI